jgi:hypothetical protein
MDEYYVYDQSAQQAAAAAGFRPSRPEDWEPYRQTIAHMYNTLNMKLKDVMAEMQVLYGFKAT